MPPATTTVGLASPSSRRRWSCASSAGSRRPRSRCAIPAWCSESGFALIGPAQRLFEHVDSTPGEYTEKDISPYFWHNGQYPDSDEYKALFDGNFADYRLRINGLVDNPVELSLAESARASAP